MAVALVCGGAVACGGSGSGALPAVTTTPTRTLSSQPQPSRSAGPPLVTPSASPTAAASSAAVVAPSSVTTPTATTPVSASSDSGSTWGWWVLGIVLLAAVIGWVIWAVLSRKRKWAVWRAAAAPVAQQTHVVTDLLPMPPDSDQDPDHWHQVREQAERNAQDLESVAASAPSGDATQVTQGVARALREELTAVEAFRLLEVAPRPPTGRQLSQAEDATRQARIDLDTSQARLDALIGAQRAADDRPSASIN